jgi:hypothetical protein
MRIVDWAQEADAAYQIAQRLVVTSFVPPAFHNKPADAAAAILAGSGLGLDPLQSVGAFNIIQGRAAASAMTLRAIVQAAGHEIVLVESGPTRCRMKGRRAGETEWQEVLWTHDRAKQLGVTGKENWRKQPQAMLVARATSELCRLVAADAIMGIASGYSAEELADGDQTVTTVGQIVEAETPAAAPVGMKRMQRKPLPKVAPPPPEPEPDPVYEDPDDEAEDEANPEGPENEPEPTTPEQTEPEPTGPEQAKPERSGDMTVAQSRKMGALMRQVGLTDRDDALFYVAGVIGHPVNSRSELSKDEASQVIEQLVLLQQEEEGPPPVEDPWSTPLPIEEGEPR